MHTTSLKISKLGAILTCTLLVTSCGEFSYKRGASSQDLEKTKQMCKSSNDEKSVEDCLKKNGWSVQQLDDIDLFAIPSVNPDNRAIGSPKSSNENEVNKPSSDNESLPKTATKVVEHDPDEVFSIGSWWKIGGSDALLRSDINQCLETLGESHRPVIAEQKYTYGMIVCLHNKGWKALKNVK